jgi:hypothetical protein
MTSYPHTDGSRATWNGDSRGPRYCKDEASCEEGGGARQTMHRVNRQCGVARRRTTGKCVLRGAVVSAKAKGGEVLIRGCCPTEIQSNITDDCTKQGTREAWEGTRGVGGRQRGSTHRLHPSLTGPLAQQGGARAPAGAQGRDDCAADGVQARGAGQRCEDSGGHRNLHRQQTGHGGGGAQQEATRVAHHRPHLLHIEAITSTHSTM